MNPSISVIVPVHNGERTIATTLKEVFDIVVDLTTDFEVLVLDDGSNDDTAQVLVELSRRFPQMSAVSSPHRVGFVEAVQSGLQMVRSPIIFVQDAAARPSPAAYRQMWNQRLENVPAMPAAHEGDVPWLGRLVKWGTQVSGGVCRADVPSGLQMIRRGRGPSPTPSVPLRHVRTDAPQGSGVPKAWTDELSLPAADHPLGSHA